MIENEHPDSRFLRLSSAYGPEGARAIVETMRRLVGVLADEQILDADEVADRLGVSRKTVQRMLRSGELPAPIQVTGNRFGWRKSDFERWIAGRPLATRK